MVTTFLACLVCFALGWVGRAWIFPSRVVVLAHTCEQCQKPMIIGAHRCDVCDDQLPKSAIRTHSGKWRCAEHKALA